MSLGAAISEPQFVNTRRHARYRITEKILLHCADHCAFAAITRDISISGLSISSAGQLQVGDIVELERVADLRVKAVVRHRTGEAYGLEFVDVPPTLTPRIHALCRGLFRLSHASESQP